MILEKCFTLNAQKIIGTHLYLVFEQFSFLPDAFIVRF